jgi:hypothetical protein
MEAIVLALPEGRRKKPTAAGAGWVSRLKEKLFFWLPALDAGSPLSDQRL